MVWKSFRCGRNLAWPSLPVLYICGMVQRGTETRSKAMAHIFTKTELTAMVTEWAKSNRPTNLQFVYYNVNGLIDDIREIEHETALTPKGNLRSHVKKSIDLCTYIFDLNEIEGEYIPEGFCVEPKIDKFGCRLKGVHVHTKTFDDMTDNEIQTAIHNLVEDAAESGAPLNREDLEYEILPYSWWPSQYARFENALVNLKIDSRVDFDSDGYARIIPNIMGVA
jgi:hypothetical protein